ncbi:iron complex transport system substrate-binding protein [Devosia lucknowensis]|uniref:Iron complex transport system substrate-binding protein n=1 Tax=Devosia lucknowensis TaxID=1096929 RepID=A0A1Y6G5R0_9HYPH|nr:ABC transporter substrate-binding protein [Devosia lucknowensis]SMQ85406.1 iron complex transport system substrate-binding protein [Devosia lucknowensis]
MRRLFFVIAALAGLAVVPAFANDTRSITAANGTFDIPSAPQRIVALNDQIVALPLLELGAPVVGSAGRLDEEGKTFMRGGMDTLGVDFSNTDIKFVGLFNQIDIEAIAALDPDLIIGGTYTDPAVVEQLQKIAPTLVIDNGALGLVETLRTLADVSGKAGDFEARFARYQSNIERTRGFIGDTASISATTTFMFPDGEELWVYRANLGAITQVLGDLGFSQPKAVSEIAETQVSWSAELIQELDADFIFGFYRQQPDATPDAIRAAYEKFAPGWCQALTACQNGQMILLPGPTFGSTMTGLELALELVENNVAGRPFTPFTEAP